MKVSSEALLIMDLVRTKFYISKSYLVYIVLGFLMSNIRLRNTVLHSSYK